MPSGSQQTITFTNQSQLSTSWMWDFGDGSGSTLQNPVHTYAAAGTYTVCLTAINSCGQETSCQSVTANPNCAASVANFGASTNFLAATFTDASTNAPTSWAWDFGDGSGSTLQNPVHTYANPGTYTVCLIATKTGCSVDTFCSSVTVNCMPPVSNFTVSGSGLTQNFNNLTSGGTSWFWDFGDGNASTLEDPTHTYATAGTYTVCLTATNACTSDTSCTNVTVSVSCSGPVASFGNASNNLTVNFTDMTTNGPTSWAWDFGDGNASTLQNPTHTYTSPGTYTVCLTATNGCATSPTDNVCQSVTVSNTACSAPTAAFNHSISNFTVNFTDVTGNMPTAWSWDFGNGITSTLQNPTHTYSTPGTYTVCLIATNGCANTPNDTICESITVTGNCSSPVSDYSTTGTNLTIDFADLSTGMPTTWSWDFGDGSSSNLQNPSYTYAAAGSYTVCLVTTNACGTNTVCNTIVVGCTPPNADFGATLANFDVTFVDASSAPDPILSWMWDFGDGNTSTVQSPTHTYTTNGTYTVCLTVTTTCATDSTCQTFTFANSVEENLLQSALEVYPNPTAENFFLEIPEQVSSDLTVELFDFSGKLVLSEVIQKGITKHQVEMNDLADGLYHLRVYNDQEAASFKVIRTR